MCKHYANARPCNFLRMLLVSCTPYVLWSLHRISYRMIKKSLCTWRLQYNHQEHRDCLITLCMLSVCIASHTARWARMSYAGNGRDKFFIKIFRIYGIVIQVWWHCERTGARRIVCVVFGSSSGRRSASLTWIRYYGSISCKINTPDVKHKSWNVTLGSRYMNACRARVEYEGLVIIWGFHEPHLERNEV